MANTRVWTPYANRFRDSMGTPRLTGFSTYHHKRPPVWPTTQVPWSPKTQAPSFPGGMGGFNEFRKNMLFPWMGSRRSMTGGSQAAPSVTGEGAETSSTTTTEPGFTAPGVPDMGGEANTIVAQAIAEQKAANDAARQRAMAAYAAAVAQLENQLSGTNAAIEGRAKDDRAALNNLMASRGIGVGEGAAMNFSRFDEGVQEDLSQALAAYNAEMGAQMGTRDVRVGELSEMDRLLDQGRMAEYLKLREELTNSAFGRSMDQAQFNAQYGGTTTTTDAFRDIGADISAMQNDNLSSDQILEYLNNTYRVDMGGRTLQELAAAGDQNALYYLQQIQAQAMPSGSSWWDRFIASSRSRRGV